MANIIDPDDLYDPSNVDLHCMRKGLSWSTGLKNLNASKAKAKRFRMSYRIYPQYTYTLINHRI